MRGERTQWRFEIFTGKEGTMPSQRRSIRRHLVDGTARADRMNAAEPVYPVGAPGKPDSIAARPDASRAWDRIVPLLVGLQMLTAAVGVALVGYCASYADVLQAERVTLEPDYLPVVVVQTRDGAINIRPHPAIGNGIRSSQELRQWATQLGLTPASRATVCGILSAPLRSPSGSSTSARAHWSVFFGPYSTATS